MYNVGSVRSLEFNLQFANFPIVIRSSFCRGGAQSLFSVSGELFNHSSSNRHQAIRRTTMTTGYDENGERHGDVFKRGQTRKPVIILGRS